VATALAVTLGRFSNSREDGTSSNVKTELAVSGLAVTLRRFSNSREDGFSSNVRTFF